MPLIGIDPDATRTIDVKGSRFVIGVIPSGVWQRIKYQNISAYEEARRRVLRDLIAAGEDPHLPAIESDDKTVSVDLITFRANNDPKLREELVALMVESVRWSVRLHEDFLKPDGTPIPFETEEATHEGERFKVVAPSTLRWYRQLYPLLLDVYLAARSLADLSEVEKKVLPPPPSSTGSSSRAKGVKRRRRS